MARDYIALFFCLIANSLSAQQPIKILVKTEDFRDENGQRISFQLPQNWKFEGGIVTNAKGIKVGEFMPGTIADCKYKSGSDFIRKLRAGYPDDMGNPQFVGSRTLLIGSTTWTEGVRNVPAWDGKKTLADGTLMTYSRY